MAASRRGSSPSRAADAAAGVEHEQHPSVLLGAEGAHDDPGGPGGRPPVDRRGVVARDVGPQGVELACPRPARRAITLPSSSRSRASLRRQQPPRRERRAAPAASRGARAGAGVPASPSGPRERTATRTAGRAPRRVGRSGVTTSRASPGASTNDAPARFGAGRRHPPVAHRQPRGAAGTVAQVHRAAAVGPSRVGAGGLRCAAIRASGAARATSAVAARTTS